MIASIVVGLGFGDEGKGMVTNSLISNLSNTIVVRFSGGQQAGHTVIHNGIRHVFSSYGSGTLKGVPTYISDYCTVDFNAMMNENKDLAKKKVSIPSLFVHPLALVTTKYDIIANREDVKYLSDGTTGMGVGKTVERHEKIPFYAIDLSNEIIAIAKMKAIAKYYELPYHRDDAIDLLSSFIQSHTLLEDYRILDMYSHVIFEGSQGTLLDMDHGTFPNVTYSNTTVRNAMEILQGLPIRGKIDINYVTRSYLTRHGNGELQKVAVKLKNNEGETNKLDPYQGEFRTAQLDIGLLNHAFKINNIYSGDEVYKTLWITCMDQYEMSPGFISHFADRTILSYSPTGLDIKEYKKGVTA